jgi:hypothetical protein
MDEATTPGKVGKPAVEAGAKTDAPVVVDATPPAPGEDAGA